MTLGTIRLPCHYSALSLDGTVQKTWSLEKYRRRCWAHKPTDTYANDVTGDCDVWFPMVTTQPMLDPADSDVVHVTT